MGRIVNNQDNLNQIASGILKNRFDKPASGISGDADRFPTDFLKCSC